jgi:hypothetical protein
MNRKQFLKSLLVLPVVGLLFGQKISAKEKDIIKPNPYKLPFINSKNNIIGNILLLNDSKFVQVFFDGECEKIRSLIGNDDFYCIDYLLLNDKIEICNNKKRVEEYIEICNNKKYRDKMKLAIVGHKLDWWSPVNYTSNEKYTLDMDAIKDVSTHLTIQDKETIKKFLHNKKAEQMLLNLHNKKLLSTDELKKTFDL